jgi:hypothetical protein
MLISGEHAMIRDLRSLRKSFERHVDALAERISGRRWGPTARLKLEEELVIIAYELQKLLDDDVFAGSFPNSKIPVLSYPYHSTIQEGSHWRDYRLHYSLDAGEKEDHDPLFICHQVTQNALLAFEVNEFREIASIRVTSSHQKKQALYQISRQDLLDLFTRAKEALRPL